MHFGAISSERLARDAHLLPHGGSRINTDTELCSTIQAATNKSESFNDFVKWLAFGGGGVIAENDRAEQRKIIKYNHLLANCLIFHNVCLMTRALHKLRVEGVPVEADSVAALSPYIRSHISRFGRVHARSQPHAGTR